MITWTQQHVTLNTLPNISTKNLIRPLTNIIHRSSERKTMLAHAFNTKIRFKRIDTRDQRGLIITQNLITGVSTLIVPKKF
jgi:hypothetical protein